MSTTLCPENTEADREPPVYSTIVIDVDNSSGRIIDVDIYIV